MARDVLNKLHKKDKKTNSNKKIKDLRKKKIMDSDSDNDNDDNSDSEADEMDMHEFRKYIKKIFPSKHLDKKIKAGEKLKQIFKKKTNKIDKPGKPGKPDKNKKKNGKSKYEEEEDDYDEDDDEDYIPDDEDEDDEDDEDGDEHDDDEDEDDDEDDEGDDEGDDDEDDEGDDSPEYKKEETKNNKKSNKFNIILTIDGSEADENEDWEDYDEYEESYENSISETEDEDEEVSTDSEEEKGYTKQKRKNIKNTETTEEDNEVILKLKELQEKNPNDKSIQKCMEIYKQENNETKKRNEKKQKKQKDKNMRIFRKMIKDKNTMNDFSFYEKMEIDHQKKLIKELREINKITRIEKPYRMTILESDIPVEFKAAAIKKINSLRYLEPGSGEYYKIKNWVDTFMKIPFSKFQELPISIKNGVDECHDFMKNAQNILDTAVYGLNDAKMQIMQMLGQLLTNPKSIGTAIAIHGPPGTGKTSLVKEGISKILNRPFAFIALGGATDSSFLEGHSYTYEGSTWGKIVQILVDSKCMNPVIYFDELDKISDTPRGEEIAGILTHLTDTSQNSQFHDKYFAEINFDLSKCLFIFSYNDETKVNPILRDRMYRIKTKGYSGKDKTTIANQYLLPKIREQVKFEEGEIIIPDDVLNYINETHCCKEDGVRNLKRCLEIIYTKLNLYRLMKPGTNIFEGNMSIKVEFPFKVTKDIVDKLIKKDEDNISALWSMYV